MTKMIAVLTSKLHQAVVTAADPLYEGSISIDENLCRIAGLLELQQVDVYDITNGSRLTTYVIFGSHGEIQINGAAARLVNVGDQVIIAAYATVGETEALSHSAKVLLMASDNSVKEIQEQAVRAARTTRGT